MLLKAVAERYAGALLSLADKAGGLDKLDQDLRVVADALEISEGFRQALESPTIAVPKKHSIIKGVFNGKVSPTVENFLYVIVDKKREEYIATIVSAFQERLREERGEIECHVVSAKPLDKTLRKDLEKNLGSFSGKIVCLTEEVNAELLAGMVITIGDRVIDTSFRNQLREVEERLSRVE